MTQDATQPGVSPEQRRLERQVEFQGALIEANDAAAALTRVERDQAFDALAELKEAVLIFANAMGDPTSRANGNQGLNKAWGNLLGLCNIVPTAASVTDPAWDEVVKATLRDMEAPPVVHVWSVDCEGPAKKTQDEIADQIDRLAMEIMREPRPFNPVHDFEPGVNWGGMPPGSKDWWTCKGDAPSKLLGWWPR